MTLATSVALKLLTRVAAVDVAEQPEKGSGPGCDRIEIVSANGRRVIVDCDIDVETLLRIMRGLEALP